MQRWNFLGGNIFTWPGYVWCDNKRGISKRAIRDSGGVGILLNYWIVTFLSLTTPSKEFCGPS